MEWVTIYKGGVARVGVASQDETRSKRIFLFLYLFIYCKLPYNTFRNEYNILFCAAVVTHMYAISTAISYIHQTLMPIVHTIPLEKLHTSSS